MKTPDEVKKALKLCGRGCYSGCPYKSFECVEELSRDGLEYIQQLERERDAAIAQLEELGIGFGQKKPDMVEVVRCKDCKHTTRSKVSPEKIICCLTKLCGTVDPDYFCADGEREIDAEVE